MSIEIEFPATYVVFWPGQEVNACERHFESLYSLNRAMGGAPLSSRPLDEPAECSNCVNEKKT